MNFNFKSCLIYFVKHKSILSYVVNLLQKAHGSAMKTKVKK